MRADQRSRWWPGWRWSVVVVTAWVVVAVPTAVLLFLGGSRSLVLAGHDAVVRPSLDGYATLDLGPFLPNFRYPTGAPLGASIDIGKTDLQSYQALIDRYAFIASQPQGQIEKLEHTVLDLAVDSALIGGVVGLTAPALVLLVGRRRWGELGHAFTVRRTALVLAGFAVLGLVLVHPWDSEDPPVEAQNWRALPDALPGVAIPDEARKLQVEGGLLTSGTRRLVESAIDTYRTSQRFYRALTEQAPALADQLRQPAPDEVVVLLVSDRHDNIGMDPVARAIGDAGGATVLFDAGDDTSTGSPWEAFSLDSLAQAFEGYDERYAIAGNHDNGDFVITYDQKLGFTTLDGTVVDGPADSRLLGVSDPRSSGLGSWRDERGISFDEQEHRLADLACEHDADGDRVSTLLVHDANSADEALDRGCVDLVLAGHLHEQVGPSRVVGTNGKAGYTYTNGTTGGAAYALAIGSKLRRDAEVTLVTYRDGRPVGLQPVVIRTVGTFEVADYIPLDLGAGPPTTPGSAESTP